MTKETKRRGYWYEFNSDDDDGGEGWYCGVVCSHGGECSRPEDHRGEHATKGRGDVALCTWRSTS